MYTEAMDYAEGRAIDHTPASALSSGQLLQVLSSVAAMAIADIAASAKGSVQIKGVIEVRAAAVVGNVGNVIGWDEDGDPVDGTAGTGAATTVLSNADFILGSLAGALAATDGSARVRLNEFSPDQPSFANWTHELKVDDYTIDALDHGKVLHIATDAKTFTLPATAAGLEVVIVNDGADGNNIVTISPNANDKIMGPDIAGADDTDLVNTKATAVRGDYVRLRADGSNGWWIIESRGIWA